MNEYESELEAMPVLGANLTVHPAIRGVLTELPLAGTVWPEKDRERWIVAMRSVLAVVYRRQSK